MNNRSTPVLGETLHDNNNGIRTVMLRQGYGHTPATRAAALRELLDEDGLDIGPFRDDGMLYCATARALLRAARSMEPVVLRPHSSLESIESTGCACEDESWWCEDADGPERCGWSWDGHGDDVEPLDFGEDDAD